MEKVSAIDDRVKYELVDGVHKVTYFEHGLKKVRCFANERDAKVFANGEAKTKSKRRRRYR